MYCCVIFGCGIVCRSLYWVYMGTNLDFHSTLSTLIPKYNTTIVPVGDLFVIK